MKQYSILLVLFTILLSCSLYSTADECLDVAAAIDVVDYLVGQSGLPTEFNFAACDTTDLDIINECIDMLESSYTEVDSEYQYNVYLGYPSETLIQIQRCNELSSCSGYDYILSIRNDALFPNNFTRLYWYWNTDYVFDPENVEMEPYKWVSYTTTLRPWYNNTNYTWSPLYDFASNPMTGRSFVGRIGDVRLISDRLGNEPCVGCLSNSSAYQLIDMAKNNTKFTNTSTTMEEVTVQIMELLKYSKMTQWALQFYVGYSNNDFYAVSNCRVYEGSLDSFCAQNLGYDNLAYVRNFAIFADWKLHVYPINGTTLGASTQTSTFDYNCTTRPWYKTKYGWTDVYANVNTLPVFYGRTYVQPNSINGIVAFDYTSRECGQVDDDWACLGWAAAKRILPTIDVTKAENGVSVQGGFTDNAGAQILGKMLDKALNDDGSTYAGSIAIGYASDNYLAVYECRFILTMNDSYCQGHDSNRVLVIRNNATFSDNQVHYFAWKDGVMGAQVYVRPGDYFPTKRPWYLSEKEWSPEYTFTSINATGRTYIIKFMGGLLAADTYSNEPCYGDKLGGWYTNDRTITSTTQAGTTTGTGTGSATGTGSTTGTATTGTATTGSASTTAVATTTSNAITLFFSVVSALLLLLIN